MQKSNDIKFLYGKPAMVVTIRAIKYLVLGDLHIGIEFDLSKRGIHLFNVTESMLNEVKHICDELSIHNIIILGDIKNSIMRPTKAEASILQWFFNELNDYSVYAVSGNHDAYINEVIGLHMNRELIIGKYAFMHGHAKPSEKALMCNYIITAHRHATAMVRHKDGMHEEKVWVIAGINKKVAREHYARFNPKAKLIVVPAFNDMIMGRNIEQRSSSKRNGLPNGSLFKLEDASIYTLYGKKLSSKH